MKLLSSLILLILFSTLLNAEYLRTIRVGSFKSNTEAQKSLVKLKQFIAKHDNVVELQKKWHFEVKVRKSGKYYVAMVEPLTNRPVLQVVLDTLRLGYKGVYVTKLTSMPVSKTKINIPEPIEIQEIKKEIIVKTVIPEAKKETIVKTIIPEPIETIPAKTTVENIDNKIVSTQVQDDKNYLWQILFFITLIGLIIVIIKLISEKKSYQENDKLNKKKFEDIKNKDKFLVHTSNELKTSIIAIKGLTDFILKADSKFAYTDSLQRISSSAKNSIKSIDDILDISKIKNGKFEIEKNEFNINEMLNHVLTIIVMQAKQNNVNVTLSSEVPAMIIGDSFRLGQVLINILSQSVNLTKKKEIGLSVRQISNYEDSIKLEFCISDIGHSEAEIESIFKNDLEAKELSISKQLIEMMGGTITIDNKDDATRFIFTIVQKIKDSNERRHYRLPTMAYLNKKVLIVDKSAQNIASLKKRLDYFAYEVKSIKAFEDMAIDEDEVFDFIIVNQESLNSFGARKIKEMQSHGTKVVLLSELCTPNDGFLHAIEVNTSLKVPFTQDSILNMILALDLRERLSSISKASDTKEKLKKIIGKHILIVDDNILNHGYTSNLLKKAGIKSTCVSNGREAVDLTLKDKKFDVILMDINMPVLNGYEATKEIRKNKIYNNVHIFALVSSEIKSTVEKVFACGMQGSISKPINEDLFYSEILGALSKKGEAINIIPLSQHVEKSVGEEFEELSIVTGLQKHQGDEKLYLATLTDFKAMHINSSGVVEQLCKDEYFKEAYSLVSDVKDIASKIGAFNVCESATVMEYELQKTSSADLDKFISLYGDGLKLLFKNIDKYLKKF